MTDISSLNTKNIPALEFLELLERVKKTLKEEQEKRGKGVKVATDKKFLVVIGDLHGDLESLQFILKDAKPLKDKLFLFLGDYGDRGAYSPEVYFSVLKLKEKFPETILLRGNHEFPPSLLVSPHDLPFHFRRKFPEAGDKLYMEIKELWEFLPLAAILPEKYLFLHGGLPSTTESFQDLASENFLEEILWNDPREISGTQFSSRGAGKFFGKDISEKILKKLGVKTLIRSHEACEGVSVAHNGLVLTLFSRKGLPYKNTKAAYLKINLKEKAKDAYELAKEAIFF